MKQKICQWLLFKVFGWRMHGELDASIKKYLIVGLPHTSNWGFFYCLLATGAPGIKVTIFVKDVFFIGTLKWLSRLFSVAPVNRRESTNFVDGVAKQFIKADRLGTLIAPEGTRKRKDKFKSGYYYIAKQADIPIVVDGPDYANKTFTLMPARKALDSFEQDQQNVIEFARSMNGKYPEKSF